MPDDRNGVPPGPPSPFGRARGTNGVHRGEHVDLPTRPLTVDVTEGPADLVAVQADDELVNALGSGAGVAYGDRGPASDADPRRNRDERLVEMLAAWRAEVEAEPIPELIDLDTAVAAVVAGMKKDDLAGARRKRADRLRHLAPLAAAAAIIVATVSGVGLGSKDAMPGDTLWAVQKVVNPERAESVETKLVVESRLDKVRTALSTGDTNTAALELQAISTEIPQVRGEEGQPQLAQEQEYLAAKLADTPPGEPADLSTPPESNPNARSTSAPPPPSSTSTSTSTSTTPSQSSSSDDPSVSKPGGPDPRTAKQSEALVPAPGSGSEGPATSPGSGSSTPDVTKAPSEPKPAPENSEGSSDPSTPPAPSGEQPTSGGGTGGPPPGSAQATTTTGTTTATGTTASAGTSVDATATVTATTS
jgi:hypothetical protein